MSDGTHPMLSVVPGGDPANGRITVIGVLGDGLEGLGDEARHALAHASWVAGGRRHLEAWRRWLDTSSARNARARLAPTIEIGPDAEEFAHEVAHRAVDELADVCVLASGDPGFFGVVRALLRVVDRSRLHVLPGPSSVSVAFARLGLPWDDAVVVSAHGRPLADAIRIVRLARKAAVLTSPEAPPQAVGRALADAGLSTDLIAVCSRLGCHDEQVQEMSLSELAHGTFDPLSVVVVVGPGGLQTVGWEPSGAGTEEIAHAPDTEISETGPVQNLQQVPAASVKKPEETLPVTSPSPGPDIAPWQGASGRVLAWGLPEADFSHRAGMVTKSEVRAVALGKLALPPAGVLWDVGAGSGSVAIECARLCPGLVVFAIEQRPEDVERIVANAARHSAAVHVLSGRAPDAFESLPDPDRVFIGGGGIDVLSAVLRRLRPGGRVVATYTALDRAAAGAQRLGNLTQVSIARGSRLDGGGWRLAAENPVFIAWGPERNPDRAQPGPS